MDDLCYIHVFFIEHVTVIGEDSSVVIGECMDCICLHVKQFRVRIK